MKNATWMLVRIFIPFAAGQLNVSPLTFKTKLNLEINEIEEPENYTINIKNKKD